MKRFLQLLLAVLGPAAAIGVLAGLWLGWHYVTAGFPLLVLDALRRAVFFCLAGALVFVLLYAPVRRLLARWPRLAVPLAAGFAAAPFVALAGYELNRSRAIRPSELLEPYALIPNLKLLAGCFVVYVVVVLLLGVFERSSQRVGAGLPISAVGLLVFLQLSVLALYRDADKTQPDVLVLLVDALRADALGCYGAERDTSPAIDSLARDGVLFRQAIAQSTFTKTSIASLFTGRYPYRHGIYWGQRQLETGGILADLLSSSETTLAETLHANGYLTAAWVQNSHLRRVMGFSQGFVDYHDQQGSIERIHSRFLPWHRGPARRYSSFAYLHYIDLHDPYRPKPPYDTLFGTGHDVYRAVDFDHWGRYLREVREGERVLSDADVQELRALYDGQLRAIDDQIALLLEELRSSGRYDDTLIVLTSDHGDAFMEHGFISHSVAPYEELVHVPLIIKLPRGRDAGTTIEDQVRLVDVMPTLLAATGSGRGVPEMDGCNLMPWIREGQRPPAAEAKCGFAVIEIAEEDDQAPVLAVRTERYKYFYRESGNDELYDLVEDPGELQNLAGELTDDTRWLRDLAVDLAEQRSRGDVDQMELDPKIIRELQGLGYLGD